MKASQLASLRFFSLLFLIPGLGGLILAAVVSTGYLDTLPRVPVSEEMRLVPRTIHGIVVYQTKEENRRLALLEDGAVGVFVIGLILGVIYLEKWGAERMLIAEKEGLIEERN